MTRNRERFPRVPGLHKGYDRGQVDAFLRRAEGSLRRTGEVPAMTAADIRRAGFDLVRGGYEVAAVDTCLDDLEQKALDLDAEQGGPAVVPVGSLADADGLLATLAGEPGARFPHAPLLRRGYDPDRVDRFLDGLVPVLAGDAHDLTSGDVRQVVFRARRGGYDEIAVDDALDAAVELLLRRERSARAIPQAHPHVSA